MTEEKTILLADDNSDDIELTRRLFERNGIRNKLIVIHDGEQVLEYLFRQGPYEGRTYRLPSLILLNLRLPKIDGIEVLERIREDRRTSSIPVVVLLSHEQEKELVREHGLDVDGFVQKPLDLPKLEKALEKVAFTLVLERGEKEDL